MITEIYLGVKQKSFLLRDALIEMRIHKWYSWKMDKGIDRIHMTGGTMIWELSRSDYRRRNI